MSKRELRVGDKVVMVRLDRMPFTFDRIGNTGTVIEVSKDFIEVDVDCDRGRNCVYYTENEPWELLEEDEDKTYTHEEVAEILGIERDQVETISVDISDKPFEDKEPDMVNHPKHYTKGGIETLDFILAKVEGLTPQEAVLVGHIIRYVSRYNDKFNPVEDLKKAKFYLDKLIELRGELE